MANNNSAVGYAPQYFLTTGNNNNAVGYAPQYSLTTANNDKPYLGIDFETYGLADLPTVGLDNYVKHPSFRPLLLCTYRNTEQPSPFSRSTKPMFRAEKYDFDFVFDEVDREALRAMLHEHVLVAHNAGFEEAVLKHMFPTDTFEFLDSAVLARAAGFGSSLEAAAPQALGVDKLPDGKRLIKEISCNPEPPEAWLTKNHPDWLTFIKYCQLDAKLSYRLAMQFQHRNELEPHLREEPLTRRMNNEGWFVDMDLLDRMEKQADRNTAEVLGIFEQDHAELNFNSTPQMREFCKRHGIRATSFDEAHVRSLRRTLRRKLLNLYTVPRQQTPAELKQIDNYEAVDAMLRTKQVLGGSALSKIPTIRNQVSSDGRLRNQYLHFGAGQSGRTSGRGVQMQNLKRLHEVLDMEALEVYEYSNERLAENMRQLFMAEHPNGELIVGDFSSVESRGLARLAGAHWKTDAFRQGRDMYKVLAEKFYHTAYDEVSKDQRQFGKVGELSCGYQAGPEAVRRFASKMGVELTLDEAQNLVTDWRNVNPEIVDLWARLDAALRNAAQGIGDAVYLATGAVVEFSSWPSQHSLQEQHPGAWDVRVTMMNLWACNPRQFSTVLSRWFRGVYLKGREIVYHKPSERKTGPLWSDTFVDPVTKQRRRYTIYGGKLTGILTQSFCREIFFSVMANVQEWVDKYTNLKLIGQFHDELVVEWSPGGTISLAEALNVLNSLMSRPPDYARDFPLAAEIKHAHRYIK